MPLKGYKIGVVPGVVQPALLRRTGLRHAQGQGDLLSRAGHHHNQLLVQAALQISIRAGREGKNSTASMAGRMCHRGLRPGQQGFQQVRRAVVVENMLSFYEKKRRFQRDFYVGIEGPMTLRPLPGYLEWEAPPSSAWAPRGVKTALESAALISCPGHRHGQEIHPVPGSWCRP